MTTRDEKVANMVIQLMAKARSARVNFERDWQDIRDLVRPMYGGYNAVNKQHYTYRTAAMYDGTAPDALEGLASGLHSYITSPTERWFELEIEGNAEMMRDPEVLAWLERVSDIIYGYYNIEGSNFNPALHEAYLDIGSYGTCVPHQEWSPELNCPVFRTFPILDCFILENNEGRIDTLHRAMGWTLRNIRQQFGDMLPRKLMEKKIEEEVFTVIHSVFPRTDRNAKKFDMKNKKFVSAWVCEETQELLLESGYDTFPYHPARWMKLSGEIYGRSPAKKCLADIKMLNAMEKTILKAGNKMVDPPLVVPDDGFMLPLETSPGSLIYKEPGAEEIVPLEIRGAMPWAEDKAQQKREFIQRAFYADWFKMEKNNVEMTAYEVADRREEKLRQLAPMLGRLVSELHSPMIARTYNLLNDRNLIPQAPGQLAGARLKVGYRSPASVAQTGVKAISMGRFLNDLAPLAQVDPSVLDVVDTDAYARELAIARGTPRTILRSERDIQARRQQRQQEQMMQQIAGAAEPVSKAIKNVADAKAAGGIPGL